MLDILNTENYLNKVNAQSNRANNEQFDKDSACVMVKERKKVEGPMMGIEHSKQAKVRSYGSALESNCQKESR